MHLGKVVGCQMTWGKQLSSEHTSNRVIFWSPYCCSISMWVTIGTSTSLLSMLLCSSLDNLWPLICINENIKIQQQWCIIGQSLIYNQKYSDDWQLYYWSLIKVYLGCTRVTTGSQRWKAMDVSPVMGVGMYWCIDTCRCVVGFMQSISSKTYDPQAEYLKRRTMLQTTSEMCYLLELLVPSK